MMAKRTRICLDDEINKAALLKAHNNAVDAFAKLHAALEVSATMLDGDAGSEVSAEGDSLDVFPLAELIDLDDLPVSSTEH